MSAGFEVINDSQSILIDQNFQNLALISSGSISIGSNSSAGGYFGSTTIPATGVPLIFVRSAGLVSIISATNGRFDWRLAKGVTTFDYYAFAPPQSLSGNVGLQVFGSDGKLCFDAQQKYLRILGTVTTKGSMYFPDGGGVGTALSFPLPGARPAVCFSDPGGQFQVITGSTVSGGLTYRTVARCGMRINGSNLELAQFQEVDSLALSGDAHVNTRVAAAPAMVIVADVSSM
ncbi:hypothetical protein [Dyella sp. 2RAB6]|uniref:hypothetical protein n=1 Tax=Dyella sp. 2RAB6 TaxID=3232992 RepID=UPI003F91B611